MTDYEKRLTRWVKENIKFPVNTGSRRESKELKFSQIAKIIDIEPCIIYEGYCETCSYETVGIKVRFLYKNGVNDSFTQEAYNFDLGKMIQTMMTYE